MSNRARAAVVCCAVTLVALSCSDSGETSDPPPSSGPLISLPSGKVSDDVVRVAFYGDSVALGTGVGLDLWMNGPDHNALFPEDDGEPGVMGIAGHTSLGCGIIGGAPMRILGIERPARAECDEWLADWTRALEIREPHVALIQAGQWEVVDRQLEPNGPYVSIGDPTFDAILRSRIEEAISIFVDRDVPVIWLLAPHVVHGTVKGVQPDEHFPESDPARIDRFNALVREVVAESDGAVAVLDLPGLLADQPGGELDTTLRPDLVHWDVDEFHARLAPDLRRLVLATYDEMLDEERPTP